MIRRIKLDELKIGMFVERFGAGTWDEPVSSPRMPITTIEQIESLRRRGVVEVEIDTEKGLALDDAVRDKGGDALPFVQVPPKVPFADEIPVASKVYTEGLRYARQIMESARRDGIIDQAAAEAVVDDLGDSVRRNESAAVSLTRLRSTLEYEYHHAVNCSILALVFGMHLGMDGEDLRRLGVGALLHDVGKARLPENLLSKPGRLYGEELRRAYDHALEGYNLLKRQRKSDARVLSVVLQHHERYDGQGYPTGLRGEDIHPAARIVGVVDAYDAMTSERPYARARTPSETFRVMYQQRDKQFQGAYVEHFIKSMGIYPVGSFVRLSNGHYGVVCETNAQQPLRPSVKIVFDDKMRQRRAEVVDLAERARGPEPQRLEIAESLDPRDYKIDVMRLLGSG
ncbi:HD-GYP domain-containing protein [Desulfohalovibrio reitneri]|uniref:HD-GYP domain-containing protein n=1 Tax=Desulfohalovibrio reitneri TaxID=1307759 RepID=UPI000551AED4|nr:HD-GYP domain-containing protein [Desulfohalovibrio reitneri]